MDLIKTKSKETMIVRIDRVIVSKDIPQTWIFTVNQKRGRRGTISRTLTIHNRRRRNWVILVVFLIGRFLLRDRDVDPDSSTTAARGCAGVRKTFILVSYQMVRKTMDRCFKTLPKDVPYFIGYILSQTKFSQSHPSKLPNESLQELDLGFNYEIGGEGAVAVAKGLAMNQSLLSLKLECKRHW